MYVSSHCYLIIAASDIDFAFLFGNLWHLGAFSDSVFCPLSFFGETPFLLIALQGWCAVSVQYLLGSLPTVTLTPLVTSSLFPYIAPFPPESQTSVPRRLTFPVLQTCPTLTHCLLAVGGSSAACLSWACLWLFQGGTYTLHSSFVPLIISSLSSLFLGCPLVVHT